MYDISKYREEDINSLARKWKIAKEMEQHAIGLRRDIEDRIKSLAGVSENMEGTQHLGDKEQGIDIKIVGRINRSVNTELVQEIARENKLEEKLFNLFRWKADVNLKNWNKEPSDVTTLFSDAITSKPSRPSFSVTITGEK